MSPSPASPPAGRRRGALLVATALLAAGVAAPAASAAPGVFRGTGTDAAGDAPSGGLDINGADVVYNRNTGRVKGVVRMAAKPPGDVDVLFGVRQANGSCSVELALHSNVAAGTGELRGAAGNARTKATVSYANGVITVAATDAAVAKKRVDCATVNAYGAGANHTLRDTIRPAFAVTERVADPVDPEDVGEPTLPDDGYPGEDPGAGVDTDGDGIPDDFDGDGLPDAPGGGDPGDDGGSSSEGAGLSVKVYGLPRRLARGRSYEARIRIRNDGDADARKLRVRLTRTAGVAMSRRVASVSRVRAGKGVTVHVRLRLTSRRRARTVRLRVTGPDVSERATIRLRRR